jgi:tripartite-type tricarboxylate transporter receptor subunit TctC
MIASSTFMINPSLYGKVPYDPIKDFDPVTIAATTPNVLVVHTSVPATNVKELVDLIRSGKYSNYATPGAGTPSHLSGELFRAALKLELTAVPFHGGGPMIQSVLGGHTPIAFSSLPPAAPLLRDGAVRALAVTTAKRVSLLPGVPTLEEAGYPGQEGDTPQCVLVPAGTSRAIVDLLHREILRIIALPDVKEKFAAIGFEPIGTTPEEFAARIKVDVPRWAKIVREANIKVD